MARGVVRLGKCGGILLLGSPRTGKWVKSSGREDKKSFTPSHEIPLEQHPPSGWNIHQRGRPGCFRFHQKRRVIQARLFRHQPLIMIFILPRSGIGIPPFARS
ncbi:hypothetical protein AVEN_113795-1 [Araneus ventricosus]|uniref:Uncharacterized protein n=1 Tax=Araneus ventricosus TaxID=182803 RepID=A0A4Y2KKH0_ARAVE|nr:hypothetical protein AVEN_113795-1 [Araneus ventricosus]